ncbi:hypothetical protein ACU4GD_35045 [Cupriavidus basilensis]
MPDIDLAALSRTVLCEHLHPDLPAWGGAPARTRFRTMGAVSGDRQHGRLEPHAHVGPRHGVPAIGTAGLAAGAYIDPPGPSMPQAEARWLSALVGGLMFGFRHGAGLGMRQQDPGAHRRGQPEIAGGICIPGLSAYMTLRGLSGVIRVNTVDAVARSRCLLITQDLPSVLAHATGMARRYLQLGIGLVLGGALVIWALAGRGFRTFDNLLGGIAVGPHHRGDAAAVPGHIG